MQKILFFFSLSLPTTLSTHLFLGGGGGGGGFENSRSFDDLELNVRRKSEILDLFETDQSQPFCLSGMYLQVNLVIFHPPMRKPWT